MTTGVYHAGQNFKQYSDQLISDLKTFVDEKEIAKSLVIKILIQKMQLIFLKDLESLEDQVDLKTTS